MSIMSADNTDTATLVGKAESANVSSALNTLFISICKSMPPPEVSFRTIA